MKKLIYFLIILSIVGSCTQETKNEENTTLINKTQLKYIPNQEAVRLNDSAVSLLIQIDPFQDSINAKLNLKALTYLNKAIKVDSLYQLAYSNKIDVLKSIGRLEDAIRTLELASKIFYGYAESYSVRGFLYEKLGKKDSAIIMYDLALKSYQNRVLEDPENINHQINVAFILLFTDGQTEALNEIEGIIQKTSDKQAVDFRSVIKSFERDKFITNY
jgi:tetratricopeptide (TPR) repeat protein